MLLLGRRKEGEGLIGQRKQEEEQEAFMSFGDVQRDGFGLSFVRL